MVLKIISFLFIVSVAFGSLASTQVKDVPFDMNKVIQRVNQNYHNNPKIPHSEHQIPTLEGEFLIDTSIVYVAAPYDQGFSTIAFDGTNYLVVWHDYRSCHSHIYGARVSPDGTVLDPAGIAISTAADYQEYPAIAFDGTNYLVVWQTRLSGSYSDIYGARVSQTGTLLDSNGIAISTATDWQEYPSVAFDETNYLVVWEDERNYPSSYSDIYGARVSQTGTVLDPNGIAISTEAYWQASPSIAFDGTNYLVVWTNGIVGYDDIYGARVSQAGIVLDPNGVAISSAINDQLLPTIAFDGSNYLVVWADRRNYPDDIYGARVSQAGTVLDPNGISISTPLYEQLAPAIAFDGTNFLAVWFDYRNGHEYDIYRTRVSQAGTVLEPNGIPIPNAANDQWTPAIASDGSNYLVVWKDYRNNSDTSDIYGARVSQNGILLDPNGIAISTEAGNQLSPAVAFDGVDYLVVWEDWRSGYADIYGARISQAGDVIDSTGIPISTVDSNQYSPSVGFDGTNYLVVWNDRRNYPDDIYGARVTRDGLVLDTVGILISNASNHQESPSVAFDGTNYLIAWQDERNGPYDIYGARVSQAGTVLDPYGIPISTATHYQRYPAISFFGTNYLVVWEDWRGGNSDIYGARVSQDGTVIDPNGIAFSTALEWQYNPDVAFDGTNYIVVWHEDHLENSTPASDLYGAKVNPSGVLIDSFKVSTQKGNQESPAIAHGPANQVLITYVGWTSEYQNRSYNTYRIWGKFYPFIPGIAEENSKVKTQSSKFLEIYPNPAKVVMRVRYPWFVEEQTDIKIFDVSGTLVKEEKVTSAQSYKQDIKISLKGINPGIYFLRLGKETKKFLVVK